MEELKEKLEKLQISVDEWNELKTWAIELKETRSLTYRSLLKYLGFKYCRSLCNYLLPSGPVPSSKKNTRGYALREAIREAMKQENEITETKQDAMKQENEITETKQDTYTVEDAILEDSDKLQEMGMSYFSLENNTLKIMYNDNANITELESQINGIVDNCGVNDLSIKMMEDVVWCIRSPLIGNCADNGKCN
eukprot:TRINITY_DN5785_c0_g1_i1.p1 TRINITY_DN5785_c0_g1~~TRINITY_DN5785_c0_g1_i1.p1  ORF type:complete len:194 (+),score=40.80 TRINITY_DN5785_c0_g1_i1:82-663(+)